MTYRDRSMDMMKKIWKWLLLVLGAAVILVGVPVLINECYKVGDGYMTIWNAQDVLSYYGTVVGAGIAVATIAITISFNRKQIQRDGYLKSEYEKWSKIELEIRGVVEKINPQRVFTVSMDCQSAPNDNYGFILSSIQKYQMDCQIASDKLIAVLSFEDYPRVEDIYVQIREIANILFKVSDEVRKAYQKLRDLNERNSMFKMVEIERKHPGSFTEEDLEYCTKVLNATEHLRSDNLWTEIGNLNQKMVDIYASSYRNLLALIRDTFNAIYSEIQENADKILCFGGKR